MVRVSSSGDITSSNILPPEISLAIAIDQRNNSLCLQTRAKNNCCVMKLYDHNYVHGCLQTMQLCRKILR